ncbi:MAG: radical SAM protein [Spirochaetales bacterium]|nr:radical SAM protein [Spirochaetales bacterium]
MSLLSGIRQKAYRIYTRAEVQESSLRYLFFEITRRCNLNCIHCGSDCTSSTSMDELTTESWLKIIDYLKQTFDPLPLIVLTGGEPTIHRDLFVITEALKNHGFTWGMVTNGINMTESRLAKLVDEGMCSITLSFDGDREATSFIRNSPKAYDKILNTMTMIGHSGIDTRDAVTCVYPGNLNKLNWISDLLLEKGMNSHRLFRIFPKGRAVENRMLEMSFDESRQMVSWIEKNRKSYKKGGLDLTFSCEGYLPFEQDLKVRSEPFFCRSGINIASILCDGTITGCNNNGPDFYQGNIIQDNFATLWQDGFKEYRNKDWLKTGLCENCKEWKYCQGSSIHLRSKTMEGPEFCYIKPLS